MTSATQGPIIQMAMTGGERHLLESFLRCSHSYVEFGSGGSTVLAASLVTGPGVSLDSSAEWLGKVDAWCENLPTKPQLIYVDIGPVGDWGRPSDESNMDRWPSYYEELWKRCDPAEIDFCLVDGRFRVACALTALLRCGPSAIIAIRDYQVRPEYHVVEKFAVQIACCENLSVFMRRRSISDPELREAIIEFRYNPD